MSLYHCLLIGLQELELDTKQKLSEEELVTMIRESVSGADAEAFEQVAMQPTDEKISAKMAAVLEEGESQLREEDLRWQLIYEQGTHSKNAFVRDWFEYNLMLNNVLTAVICRKHGFDVRKAIVGEGEVQDMLRTSTKRDFGLSEVLDAADAIMRLCEVEDLYEREKKTDALRWEWLENRTMFNYFELENVLAYYLRAKMLYRWDLLNVEEGTKVFKALVADMKRDIKFN